MKYKDLRDFISQLEQRGLLKRISMEIDPYLEMTEIADRTLRAGGPALLFENPKGFDVPVLANLFGTPERVALGMGQTDVAALREVGKLLAFLKEPEPPKGLKDAFSKLSIFKQVLNMPAKEVKRAPCQQVVLAGDQVDLSKIPVMTCWPGDAAPLITWGLTVTRGPHKERQNLGIYRQQVLGKNKVIMRWLSHRGGALDFLEWQKAHPGQRFPVSVALGADPATILGAVTPVPDSLSEYAFAGLLRGDNTEVVKCISNDLQVLAVPGPRHFFERFNGGGQCLAAKIPACANLLAQRAGLPDCLKVYIAAVAGGCAIAHKKGGRAVVAGVDGEGCHDFFLGLFAVSM